MTTTETLQDALRRYLTNRHDFRREQVILPDGRRFGEAEEDWQEEHVFAPLDAQDAAGEALYKLLYYELPRGHAKSTVAAMEALCTAVLEMDYYIYIAASDQEQAGIIFTMLRGMVQRNPVLTRGFNFGRHEASVPATGCVIRVLTSDAPSTYGLGGIGRGYMFIADELWQWRGRELWDALFTATGKTPHWRGIVLSNAGYDFQSVAWETRELCRTDGAPFYLYSPDGPVAGWLTDVWRQMQERSLPPDVYQRLIENKWVEGAGSFITRAQLSECIDESLRPQVSGDKGQRYFAGLDLGLTHDRTALALGHLDSANNTVTLDCLRVWQGTRANPVQIADVEAELETLTSRFNIRQIACDPWQLQSTIQRMKGKLPVHEFKFTGETVRRLSETMFDVIRSGRLRLYPDAELEAELLNLNVIQKGYGWRIDHSSGGYSDRAMALGMMAMQALEEGGRGRPNVRFIDSFSNNGL